MAGGHHDTLLKDPAIEEWVWMRQNTHRYFKINRRTAPTLIAMGLVVPAITFYFAYVTQGMTTIEPKTKKSWAEAYAESNDHRMADTVPSDRTSKAYKEWRVSNLEGSGMTEIHVVVSTLALAYWCWKCKTAADFHRDPGRFAARGWQRLLLECVVFLVPMFLAITDQHLYAVIVALVGAGTYYRWQIPDPPVRHDKWAPDPRADEYARSYVPGKTTPKPYLSIYRAEMMLLTCFCILAVDFDVFPLRFAKVETFGTSVMDLGVGSFVFSAGVVGVKAFLPRRAGDKVITTSLGHQLRAGLWTALPVLALGAARLVLTESVDYQKHASEYGTHWNFFFTLGLLPVFVPLGMCVCSNLRVTATVLLVLYQGMYSLTPLGRWLEDAERTDLVSANREGIFSFVGYLAIFLLGMSLGQEVLPDTPTLKARRMRLVSVLGVWVTAFASFVLANFVLGIEPSRRFANAPYAFWVAGFNSAMLWLFMLIEEDVDSKLPPALTRAGHPAGYDVPVLLEAVNRNSLTTFLVANLLTGAINMQIETLLCSRATSTLVLAGYVLLFLLPPLLLYRAGIRIR
ncbi:Glucosaminyl phosphatidylinositol (GlcN-PI) nositol acylation protein [Coemansia biformis]|uniref:GPI-anchored wall transfer protein n=1 Tax=Coemansia biformis TaxID=1286918 RepID=A0A9W8CYW0_9FUNG|nr:Glucosaminyl phosphatidylinositol (GlcN-PI) nositol acylation protein [Coemansia biformis]